MYTSETAYLRCVNCSPLKGEREILKTISIRPVLR